MPVNAEPGGGVMRMPGQGGEQGAQSIRLRPVRLDDQQLYLELRGSAAMMKNLGGPLPAAQIRQSLEREVGEVAAHRAVIVVVEVIHDQEWTSAGNITLIPGEGGKSEIGWMLLQRWQGHGAMKAALRLFLDSIDRNYFPEVHAYPSTTNDASNALCRSLDFHFVTVVDLEFAGHEFTCNDWVWRLQPVLQE